MKRYVGLKVGASQLAAARVANNGAAELLQVAREDLEPGVVVGGELRDPEALAAALKKFFARNKLPRKNVRLGIASNRIGVRIFDVDGIEDEKQLDNAIRFRAHEVLPIPLEEAVLDYHVLRESVDADGNSSRRVLLVVAYRELVERYVSACRKAGLSLAGVDLEAFALLRALAPPRAPDASVDSALVAVSIGHDRSTFVVSDGVSCEFTRVIDWGGSSLSVAMARVLGLAPSEVEGMKRLLSLESADVPEGIEPEQYALAVDAVRSQVQGFARELVSSLQFYQHQPDSLGIGEIVVTGGTSALGGFAPELERLVGVRVRVGDPLARLKVGRKWRPTSRSARSLLQSDSGSRTERDARRQPPPARREAIRRIRRAEPAGAPRRIRRDLRRRRTRRSIPLPELQGCERAARARPGEAGARRDAASSLCSEACAGRACGRGHRAAALAGGVVRALAADRVGSHPA